MTCLQKIISKLKAAILTSWKQYKKRTHYRIQSINLIKFKTIHKKKKDIRVVSTQNKQIYNL